MPAYDLFLSHASEDKDAIARPLYETLTNEGVSVWFDEATLQLGDSLREKIDEGLAKCRFGVVILSPNFFEKRWPQRELDGLVARETSTGERAIIPVWHNLDDAILSQYSPTLADRVAAHSGEGTRVIAQKIIKVISSTNGAVSAPLPIQPTRRSSSLRKGFWEYVLDDSELRGARDLANKPGMWLERQAVNSVTSDLSYYAGRFIAACLGVRKDD